MITREIEISLERRWRETDPHASMNLLSQGDEFGRCTKELSSTAQTRHARSPEKKITVLLVDDHALVRKSLRRLLEDEDSITVVGEAEDGSQALKMVRQLNPRIVLMDCSMPGTDGVQATNEIARLHPESLVLILSMHSEDALVRRAIAAGARGYILKKAADLDLVSAIKRVLSGELVLDSQLSSMPEVKSKKKRDLTARELQILRLIVQGKSSKDIARLLGITLNTVSAHRTRISRSLGCHNSAELVAYALRNGLVQIL
jgi:two-component system, NarL family, response regulator NreC